MTTSYRPYLPEQTFLLPPQAGFHSGACASPNKQAEQLHMGMGASLCNAG